MKRIFVTTVMLLTAAAVLSGQDIPYLTGRITDTAGILSSGTKESLTALMKQHEDSTGNQIAVLTVPTIGSASIEDYALEVFEEWKLGQRGVDNGILIIVVPDDRKMRIEIGYGLEGVMTDGMAGEIIRTRMTPCFKNGDYDGGVTAGVTAVIALLDGQELEAAPVQKSESAFFDGPDLALPERILIGCFIFGIIGLFTFMGIITPGGGGWFLYFFLIPFWAMFPIIVLGTGGALVLLVCYLIGFPIIKLMVRKSKWYTKAAKSLKSKGRASIGGFNISSGSSSGSSWSSGGSSFSGGGGSSGGGGASGSW
ncbi:TPM domain-containing protein [bacterium]|nr:TPM domain-containing protein [bacterium]